MSKLEPHVLGGPPPDDDVDLFLSELDDGSRFVKSAAEVSDSPMQSSTSSEESQVKDGFIRLNDFLKRKMAKVALKNYPRSVRARAIMCYKHQKELFTDTDETVLEGVSQIDKIA